MCACSFGFGERGSYVGNAAEKFPGPGKYESNNYL